MNRRSTCLFLLTLLLVQEGASAQTGPFPSTSDTTAFRMIRATVEFLATDRKMYGQKPRVPCEPCAEYGDLNQFVNQNKLLGADQLIAEARKEAIVSSPDELRTFLLKRVTVGKRSYRTTLPAFAGYQQTMNAAVGGTPTPELSIAPPVIDDLSDTVAAAGADEPVITNENDALKTGVTPKPMPHLSLIALILSLISLVGVATLFLQRSRGSTASVKPDLMAELADLKAKMTGLQTENRKLSDRLTTLEKKDRQPSNTIRSDQGLQRQSRSVEPPTPAPPVPLANVVSPIPTPPPAPAPVVNTVRTSPTVTVQYGRTADLGDGFSVSGLMTVPDRDTVFEIHRQSDTMAFFQVSDQPNLQRLALSDPYSYLNDACIYNPKELLPYGRIQTDKPGQLSLQGDKWAIIEKAQISFQ